jgi:hypothetical protein
MYVRGLDGGVMSKEEEGYKVDYLIERRRMSL